jgi:DNA-directed RNA polymerase III subunit RPC2
LYTIVHYRVRQLRRGGRIGEFVSVYLNVVQKAVYIASDGGRVCRPLLVLEYGGGLKLSQHHIDTLGKGLIHICNIQRGGLIHM